MRTVATALTHRGRVRDQNEDALVCDTDLEIYVVCDGMGGHERGDIASRTASEVIHSRLREQASALRSAAEDGRRRELARSVDAAMQEASAALYREGRGDKHPSRSPRRIGMGTTVTLFFRVGQHALMAHVGDSRLYLLRDDQLVQLSEDHTYVNELRKRGALSATDARRSPFAHAVTRAVGMQPSVYVDQLMFDISVGDRLLLCTDGVTGHLDDAELASILGGEGVETVPQRLVDAANDRGGEDNITALAIEVVPDVDSHNGHEERRRVDLNARLRMLRHVVFFSDLTATEHVRVLSAMRVYPVSAGEIVFEEGDTDDRLFIVERGALEVLRRDTVVSGLNAGDHFGEIALLRHTPRTATVRAVEDGRLLVMERQEFDDLVTREPTLANKLLLSLANVLAARLQRTTEDVTLSS